MFYLMELKYGIFLNSKVIKIERSAFFLGGGGGTPGIANYGFTHKQINMTS